VVIGRRSLLLAGAALPVAAHAQCVTDVLTVDACLGGVRVTIIVPSPPVDLSFLNPGTLPSGVVFSRASVGTYFDAAGVLQTATTNAPRWDYDPVSHVLRGVLMETPRTNLLLNSATLGTQSATVTAAATTLSFYGTGTITMSGAFVGTLVGVGAFPQRAVTTFTPTAGALTLTVTGSVLNAQLETGSYVSTWIPTTGATVARGVEHCALTDGVALGGTTDRTIAIEAWVTQALAVSHLGSLDDATATNFMRVQSPASALIRSIITVAGVNKLTGGDVNPGTRPLVVKVALANGAIWNGAVNGVAMLNSGGPSTQFGPLTTLHCGEAFNATQQLDGAIRRVSYWPLALSPGQLQQVTT
jgi:hypothetical protein